MQRFVYHNWFSTCMFYSQWPASSQDWRAECRGDVAEDYPRIRFHFQKVCSLVQFYPWLISFVIVIRSFKLTVRLSFFLYSAHCKTVSFFFFRWDILELTFFLCTLAHYKIWFTLWFMCLAPSLLQVWCFQIPWATDQRASYYCQSGMYNIYTLCICSIATSTHNILSTGHWTGEIIEDVCDKWHLCGAIKHLQLTFA